jgi:hypothetical protein
VGDVSGEAVPSGTTSSCDGVRQSVLTPAGAHGSRALVAAGAVRE